MSFAYRHRLLICALAAVILLLSVVGWWYYRGPSSERLIKAVAAGDVAAVRREIRRGADVNAVLCAQLDESAGALSGMA